MTILWLVTTASLVVSLVMFRAQRRTGKRLEELTQQYWELRYQQSELRARLAEMTGTSANPSVRPTTPARAAADAFVPLSAVRR
jgi:hypothetical protein